jgi:glycosyltransferase involved in cell wall biosynthesis
VISASKRRRRLLFVAPVVPQDRGNGLAMRMGFFLQAYTREFDVDLAVFPVFSNSANSHDFVQRRVRRMAIFPPPAIDSHFALITAVSDPVARLEAFRRFARPSLASFAGAMVRRSLADWMNGARYEVVHVSRLYLAGVAEPWTMTLAPRRPSLVLDCDEDDALAYRRMAMMERGRCPGDRANWAEAEADAFADLAREVLPRFDLTFVASAHDAKSLSPWARRIEVAPNVVSPHIRLAQQKRKNTRKNVLFVGTMGYLPNDDAARWMITRVWPRLRRMINSPLRLLIVGSNPSASLIRLGRRQNVTVTGTVPDIAKYYRQADLAVIPIRGGGGTRIKLLEAATWGIPIVSTTLGAEGTTFRHGRELVLADNGQQFAHSCATLLSHPAYARSLAARARKRIMLEYDPEWWARRVVQHVSNLCIRGSRLSRVAGLSSCRKS